MKMTLVIYSGGQHSATLAAKTKTSTRVPFLRGILIRSLQQDAGLAFEEAYRLATAIRQELHDTPEITSKELQAKVIAHLEREYGKEAVYRYQHPPSLRSLVRVRDAKGRTLPFSRGRHRHYLESCGLSPEEAVTITAKLYEHLTHKGVAEIDSSYLARLTYRYLHRDLGAEVARRYGVWVDFMRSQRPLLLLIGGVPGSGKSTVAAEVANRLEIVRTQSTDMLREVMRMMIPSRVVPTLHTSSFKAWEVLPGYKPDRAGSDQAIADGYRAQAEVLSVGCEAVLNRALRERVSMILEGIHVHPGLLERLPRDTDVMVIFIMLAVLKPDSLRERFSSRGEQAPDRRAERYLENFDAIWRLQTFLLSEADRWKVPIIPNDHTEKTIQQVMAVIIDTLAQRFSVSPGESFQAKASKGG